MRTLGQLRPFIAVLGVAAATTSTMASERSASTDDSGAIPAIGFQGEQAPGSPIRRAGTGHLSNYDEAHAGPYTLPDPLVLENGRPVRDADTWFKLRRPEILKAYENDVYGRVPPRAPKVRCEQVGPASSVMDGIAIRRELVFHASAGSNEIVFHVHVLLPAKARAPVPLLLHLVFFDTPAAASAAGLAAASGHGYNEGGAVADILRRGYGYATLRYTEIEGDSAAGNLTRVRALALAPGQGTPLPDEWGTITAWAWGLSRVLDYFETDPAVDARRVGIIGHSRLGKTALWAGALDSRFALVYSSCSGEMGSALARRDYGETVDDMAETFPWQFAANFQKYKGRWSDMPVDAHLLIALNAPRPVFITGGTEDQWADPRGEYLAAIAAGPVYRLLGVKDLGTEVYPPPIDAPLISGYLGFFYHAGGHLMTLSDWAVFLDFADAHLKPRR
jgi:hypothetical protein